MEMEQEYDVIFLKYFKWENYTYCCENILRFYQIELSRIEHTLIKH